MRTEGALTFASAPNLREEMLALINEAKPRCLLLDCSAIPFIEYTALKLLIDFEEKLGENDITLWLAALNPRALDMVKRSGLFAKLGHERMFHNTEEAVHAYSAERSYK